MESILKEGIEFEQMQQKIVEQDKFITKIKTELSKCLKGNVNSHQIEIQNIRQQMSQLGSYASIELLNGYKNQWKDVF